MHKTYEDTLADLKAVIAEKGEDFVYQPVPVRAHFGDAHMEDTMFPMCAYFEPETGAPSCGVGHVLAHWGFGLQDMGLANTGASAMVLASALDFELDAKAAELLYQFQNWQDQGLPWGMALREALATINNQEN